MLQPSFRYPDQAQLWTPTGWTDEQRAVRDNHFCLVVARLAPGMDVPRAQAEMDTISHRLATEYPVDDSGWGAVVVPIVLPLFHINAMFYSVAGTLAAGCSTVIVSNLSMAPPPQSRNSLRASLTDSM